ncbi:MAG: D-aminoacyl-tRNA deacylase [Sphaerochaeta sp.]|jgi:D-tyrosyl-tRNA(Tyr) deacylase|uniref:D-aminoacyl-tRNA deacylase n=1 Tax=Sphaerochaeta sp. TaxID=1972642 RepID=UPI001D522CB5|nr:D-aminoacyl-tRNA deacylase [uncultured Sphaerochaeta sp.]MDD3057082.1 D-aminoacyl-tRNA deacylase [Sphaerochaeta sp.]MDD3929140.1 D-aminoacyl-tRNA deacylase [Sphaerochaeta sp.]NCC13647.1 D-tyrosyl-tRNA(Tyr) deacylase [Spirochaetia bacterium]NCC89173.1 D-tyrosyl-tRNA(Tyr) deacylase [Spirochaetia bacterium]
MKAVIQRVRNAQVSVDSEVVGRIGFGLLIYLGVQKGDTLEQLEWLCAKIAKFRIFSDEKGKMNLSAKDVGASLLVVSQFTLVANLSKGNRPSYDSAADPKEAEALYEKCLGLFKADGFLVQSGMFGAHMDVTYTNDGPVTFILES